MKLNRICVYPKDIQRLTGRSERHGRRMLSKCKKQLGKEEHQLVTIEEFASFIGLPAELVQEFVVD